MNSDHFPPRISSLGISVYTIINYYKYLKYLYYVYIVILSFIFSNFQRVVS